MKGNNTPVRHPYFKINKRIHEVPTSVWHHVMLQKTKLNELTLGEGGAVAIIDSGIDKNHDELKNVVSIQVDRTREGKRGGDHGTFVAGEIAGRTLGLFPRLKLGDFKALTAVEGLGQSDWVANCVNDALAAGFEVINASLGSNNPDTRLKNSVAKFCENPKHFFVAAAGNDGKGTKNENTIDYPAAWNKEIDGIIAVGAVGLDKKGNVYIPTWSSRGSVTIVAPGVEIIGILPNNEYGIMSGTSMATPIIAALIAAAKTLNPDLDHKMFNDAIIATSKDKLDPGIDSVTGIGLVQAYDLLLWIKNKANPIKKEPIIEKPVVKKPKKKTFFEWIKFFFAI